MNAKERFYSGLAKETIGKITSNTDNWTSFLRTMSRNYEFTYPEQVMIYAQRPNATFCKPYEDWNAENYRRYVKRGSTGIALFVMNRDMPLREYQTDMMQMPLVRQFITDDEVNADLTRGSGFSGGKARIYNYWQENHSAKEKMDFLKHEYGTGGHSHACSGATHSGQDHDAKGVAYPMTLTASSMPAWEISCVSGRTVRLTN